MTKIPARLLLADSEAERGRQLKRMLRARMERKAEGQRTSHNAKNLTGKLFGRLRVVRLLGSIKIYGNRRAQNWQCLCDCGQIVKATTNILTQGDKKSCGCLKRDTMERGANFRHGCARSKGRKLPIYHLYRNMISRCYSQGSFSYKDYGAKGIRVCRRWLHSFENFLADMGHRPPGLSLERRNFRLGYSKRNCRWAGRMEQANNTSRNVRKTFNGRTMTLSQWARELSISPSGLTQRFAHGWSTKRALTEPVRRLTRSY